MQNAIYWSPQRKAVRALLRPFAVPSFARSLPLLMLDGGLYVAALVAVVVVPGVGWKLLASIVVGLAIARLFVLGHDACHQALTPSRRANAWLGRIVFLPSLTCYSLWGAGHNLAHHGFTGLRGQDMAWVPLSPKAYLARSRGARWLYRAYRSWWGAGLYYGHDIWWRQQFFPRGKVRRIFTLDSWLVTAFLAAQVGLLTGIAHTTGQSPWLLVGLGVALPYLLWLWMAGFVFYLHHTDETARWFDDEVEWRAAQPHLDGTHGTHLPLRIDMLLHHALEHTAHHVNPAIPCYRLAAAQRALEVAYPAAVPMRPVTWRRYLAITRTCQLYDSRDHRWVTFAELESIPLAAGSR